ncbi:MAG: SH3 domain-containing protein [Lachnospiraceae bacterium]|nr:SH3 domain-containing protein [Lachnospiraceae bacterium]
MRFTITPEIKKKIKRLAGCIILVAVMCWGIYHYVSVSQAQTGIVNTNGGSLTVRTGPGTNYGVITSLKKGTAVTILAEENGWYKVNYGSGEGYVSGQFIQIQPDPDVDEAYVAQLMGQGFPRSYAVLLAGLHEAHPAWVFQPVNTGLEWNTVIDKESVVGINMVPTSSNDSWKSTLSGAYNWTTNKWTILDGSGWVGASPEIISYYMDPRNFLNETDIFQFETLGYQTYQSAADVQNVLNGTFMAGALRDDASRTYANTFVEAGQGAGVNPLHLAARCRQEQGQGTSPLISGTYSGFEGYYNYFNIGAYGTPSSVLYNRGLTTAKNNGWNSVYSSIVGGSTHLADKYINKRQDTLYFQKFNVVGASLFQHQYMANLQAAVSEGRTMGKAYSNKEQAFVFLIPVYSNMPEAPCSQPSSGNPNNWLKSLAVDNCNLTPAFSGSVTQYSLIVGENTAAVTIQASPVAGTSSVAGTGTVNLNHGHNSVKVTCTAQNGTAREYVIDIVRQGSAQYAKGDVNGDGGITLLDMLLVKRHILGLGTLTGDQFSAADINGDGRVDLLDCLKVKRHILGYEYIR